MKFKMAGVCRSKVFYGSPIIAVLGCTGTGKSKLAIELARKFNGEIINADAMQMYQGLDIITNKVTEAEQQGIPHHLLGILNPSKVLTVCQYKQNAINIIEDIIERKKLPIVVGGTFYYVESILYDFTVGNPECNDSDSREEDPPKKKLKTEDYAELEIQLDRLETEVLYKKLKEVDPALAETVHPNSRRKILRGVLAYYQHGEPLSTIIERQRSQPGGSNASGPLKFTNSLIIWLKCDPTVLNERLNDRVDDMLARGLFKEVLEFHEAYKNFSQRERRTGHRGILQSIGFKEFNKFLLLDEEKRESEEGKKLFENGVNLLKLSTWQYAKQQSKWVHNRFLKNRQRQQPPVYSLDVSDLSKWNENVRKLAEDIVGCHLAGKSPPVEPVPVCDEMRNDSDKVYHCSCGLYLCGKKQYEIHLNSKNHKRLMKVKSKEKAAENVSDSLTK